MRIGIVGYGTVGMSLERLFDGGEDPIVVYDKFRTHGQCMGKKEDINLCDLVFVAVPTPAKANGECDVTQVEDVVSWITPPICIKSTVPPGTTARLCAETGREIVFSPEYIGETRFHKYRDKRDVDLVVVGGEANIARQFTGLYRSVLGPEPHYFVTDAITAELAKYMENCFFATKVAFVAQFYLLAEKLAVDFDVMREIWLADTRVGRSHSAIVGSPGFGGKCLPKDLAAIVFKAREAGVNCRLLEEVQEFNRDLKCVLREVGVKG